jgi:MFS family permease
MPDDESKGSPSLSFLHGNMLVMIVTSALWQFAGNSVWPFFSIYVLALGGTPETIGIINGVGTLASILPTLMGGYLADIYGRKRLTALFSVVLGFTSIFMAAASDWRILMAAVVIESLASGFREPAMSALIADSLSPESRGVGFAAWAIIPTIPAAISPIVTGYMIDLSGVVSTLRWGYALTGVAALTAGLCRYAFLKETVRPRKERTGSSSVMAKSVASTYKQLTRELRVLLTVESLLWLGWAVASPYFILYGTSDIIGLTATEWGVVLLVSTLAKVLGFVFGSFADRYGRRNVTVLSLALVSASSFLFVHSRTLPEVTFIFTINSLSTLVGQQLSQALRADVCPRESRSRVYSFFIVWQYAARTSGSIIGGALYTFVSKAAPFYFQAFVTVVCVAVLLYLTTERTRPETHVV